jgi:hypothetical protein
MADGKNQHFVPRCALKPFSVNAEGRAIHTYILTIERAVQNARLRNQCSRDYFYGKELTVEKALGELEGHYARILASLMQDNELDSKDEEWLRLFALVQNRRTERAIADMAYLERAVSKATFARQPEQRPPAYPHSRLIAISMASGLGLLPYARDLKCIILRNKTADDFIISDNPGVINNRFSFERADAGFGMINSGIFLSLPLSPRLSALFFDVGIYTVSIPQGTRFVDVKGSADIMALNHLQCLNANYNL